MSIIIKPVPNPVVEALLRDWNLRFELLEAVPIESIVQVSEQQARAVANRATRERIEEYAEQMKAGAPFPPFVLREPRIQLDGNTRREAALLLDIQYFPAYIVSDITSNDLALALSTALNQLNGDRLTDGDAMHSAMRLLDGDLELPITKVAGLVGRSPTQIRHWQALQTATEHADRLGISEQFRSVRHDTRKKLAKVTLDEPFRRLVEVLSTVKNVPARELNELIEEIGKASSEQVAARLVTDAAEVWRPVGPDAQVARNRTAQHARMIIPQLLNMGPADVVDPARIEEDRELWEQLRVQVEAVLTEMAPEITLGRGPGSAA
jgi:hypothetical protein